MFHEVFQRVGIETQKETTMDFPNLGTNPELDDIMQRAKEFNIEDNLLDMHTYGVTVIPPEIVAAGMRITLPYVYGRSYLQPIHTWTEALKEGDNNKWVEKYPELEKVLGLWHPYPTDRYGPDVPEERDERNTNMRAAGDNIYA